MAAAQTECAALSAPGPRRDRIPDLHVRADVRRSHRFQGLQACGRHLGERVGGVCELSDLFSVLPVLANHSQYARHQPVYNRGNLYPAGFVGAHVQPDACASIQEVLSGFHVSAAFYFDGRHVRHDPAVFVAEQRHDCKSFGACGD